MTTLPEPAAPEPQTDPPEPADNLPPPEPVAAEPAPVQERIQIPIRQPEFVQVLTGDELEGRIDQAIQAIQTDDMLSVGQKASEIVKLEREKASYRNEREERQERLINQRRRVEEDQWTNEVAMRGKPREELQSVWAEVYAEQTKQRPGADPRIVQGAAILAYEQKLAQTTAPVATGPVPVTAATATRPVGSTRPIPRGGRAVVPPPPKRITVQEMIDSGKIPDDLAARYGVTPEQLNAELGN